MSPTPAAPGSAPAPPTTAAQQLGTRLRGIRHQQGLSLADVQARSGGRWKAVVVGAYERGDRSVSIDRLEQLARFYGVPIADLLAPVAHRAAPTTTSSRPAAGSDTTSAGPHDPHEAVTDGPGGRPTVLDLTQLDLDDQRIAPICRFVTQVRRQRGDHNGRVLSLRRGDLQLLAMAVGTDVDDLRDDLAERGVLRPPAQD